MPLFIPLRPLVLRCLVPFGAVDYPESPSLFSDPFLKSLHYGIRGMLAAVSCHKVFSPVRKNLLFLRVMNTNSSGSEAT